MGCSRVEDSRANRSDQRHFVSFKCFFLHCFRHLPFTLYVSLTHTQTLSPHIHTHTHTNTLWLPCPGGHFTNLFISPGAANAAFFPCLQFIWLVVVADPPPRLPYPPSLPLLFVLVDCCCCAYAPLSAFRATGCALLFDQRRGTCSVSNAKFTHSLRARGHNVVSLPPPLAPCSLLFPPSLPLSCPTPSSFVLCCPAPTCCDTPPFLGFSMYFNVV